ncbi:MAG: hypothetical protein Q8P18_14435 [Pseudomonadota bacterium]|nr:hypothetical protein [Pseudomonadota bacterium]
MSRLDQLAIQSPCSASWAKMDGTDTRRFCVSCEKAVHNLSAMAPCEAEALLASPGPAPCVRFLRRGDGSIVFNLARAAALAATSALVACGAPHHVELMGDVAYVPPVEPVVVSPVESVIPEATEAPPAPEIPVEVLEDADVYPVMGKMAR